MEHYMEEKQLEPFRKALMEEEKSPRTLEKYIRDLRKFFRYAQRKRAKGKKRLSLLMQTLCSTGIRISELPFITVEAVRKGSAMVCLKGKIRKVILPEKLCTYLLAYALGRGIVRGSIFITRSGRMMDRSNVLHEMKGLAEAAGVDCCRIFPHNLRHLFACTYYETEKDLSHLADILGHSSVNTTRIYTMRSGREQAEQIGSLDLLWDEKKAA